MPMTSSPLVMVGDLFARRAFNALPAFIRRRGGGGGGAIVGFANSLVRLFVVEQRWAVLVGRDTLDAPNFRQQLFPPYQGGRDFDPYLVDQLAMLPDFVSACGFAVAKTAGYEADDFRAAAVASEDRAGGAVLVASGDRDAFQLASASTTVLHPVKAGDMARIGPAEVRERYGVDPKQVRTSSPCADSSACRSIFPSRSTLVSIHPQVRSTGSVVSNTTLSSGWSNISSTSAWTAGQFFFNTIQTEYTGGSEPAIVEPEMMRWGG